MIASLAHGVEEPALQTFLCRDLFLAPSVYGGVSRADWCYAGTLHLSDCARPGMGAARSCSEAPQTAGF